MSVQYHYNNSDMTNSVTEKNPANQNQRCATYLQVSEM